MSRDTSCNLQETMVRKINIPTFAPICGTSSLIPYYLVSTGHAVDLPTATDVTYNSAVYVVWHRKREKPTFRFRVIIA